LPTRPIRRATEKRLSEAAESGHAVLVVPEGRIKGGALRQLPMPNLAAPWFPLLGGIVRAFALQSKVETFLYAPADARVVLHRATTRMWVDRVLCKQVTDKAFKAIEALIVHQGQAVHSKEIAHFIAGRLANDDTTRKAVNAFKAAVKRAYRRAKKRIPADLDDFVDTPRHGHWSLTVKGFVD
jgi:hypothetical protein